MDQVKPKLKFLDRLRCRLGMHMWHLADVSIDGWLWRCIVCGKVDLQ